MADTVTYTSDAAASETILAAEIVRFSVGGIPNIRQVSFSLEWTDSDNTIVATVNGVALPTILFDTDHDTTMETLRASLENVPAIVTAVLSSPTVLVLTGKDGVELTIDSIITSGTTVPVATITELQAEVSLTVIHLRSRETVFSTDSVATLVALLP